MATTVNDVIARALRMIGVLAAGEPVSATDAKNGLSVLNQMLESWSNEHLAPYRTINATYALVANQQTYTIANSSDADWQIDRPLMVDKASAFVRDSNNYDYPVDYLTNTEFQNLGDKSSTASYPIAWTYDPDFPLARIKLYPVPTDSGYSFGLSQTMRFACYEDVSDALDLPPGYENAVTYAMAAEFGPEYGVIGDRLIIISDRAKTLKNLLKTTNSDTPLMELDDDLLRHGGRYNAYTDSYR